MAVQSEVNGNHVYKCKKFSGVEKIDTFTGSFTLYVNSKVSSGNLRICLVSNNEIVEDFALNVKDNFMAIGSNTYDLYIAGESANFDISYFTE